MINIRRYLSRLLSGCPETVIISGGAFWCLVDDFSKLPGVTNVVAGYSGGKSQNPTYDSYMTEGHQQVVEVTYDNKIISFVEVVVFALKHMDPTDPNGSFYDRGQAFAPAIYVNNKLQMSIAKEVIDDINQHEIFPKPLRVTVAIKQPFYMAEAIHQTYHSDIKTSGRYEFYRSASGRDRFLYRYWGDDLSSHLPW